MSSPGTDTVVYWPMLLYFVAVLVVVVSMVVGSFVLGQRSRGLSQALPYESGVMSTGSARIRFSADFYLMAMFFVIFDLESVYVFAWATAVPELGWLGYAQICIFIGVVLASLVYLWRQGALES